MALEISPTETFNQIKEINELLNRNKPKFEPTDKKEEKDLFTFDDEIDLRALILQNTNANNLTKIQDIIKIAADKGFSESNVVDTINKMISEKVLESLQNRFVIQIDDSD